LFQLDFSDHTSSAEILAPFSVPNNSMARLFPDGKAKSVSTRSPSFTKTSIAQASTKMWSFNRLCGAASVAVCAPENLG